MMQKRNGSIYMHMCYWWWLFLTKYISAFFLFFLSVGGFFSIALFGAVVHDVCFIITFVTHRVGHRAWAVLWQLFSPYLCGARQQHSLCAILFPGTFLQESHTLCTGRFVLGSSIKIIAFFVVWCNWIKARGNIANLWLCSRGIYIGVTLNT